MKRQPQEGRYSRVTRRMWNDKKFRALSAPTPNARTLWLRLLTGTELGCIPGLFTAREGGLADALEWPVEAFRACWAEIVQQEMATADWQAGLVWVPNAIIHNPPESPNHIRGWRLAWLELPECELKRRAEIAIRDHITALGSEWLRAFDYVTSPAGVVKPFAKPLVKASVDRSRRPSPKLCGNQDQDQDQDQISAAADPSLTGSARVEPPEPEQRQQPPTSLREALELPIAERSKLCVEEPHRADWLQPTEWPELKTVVAALYGASQLALPKLGPYTADSGVRALVGLYAAGFTQAELEHAARVLPTEPWWRSGRRGLASLTPEVVRRALGPKPEPSSGKFARAEDDESRRLRRNNLLDDALAGRFGADVKKRAASGEKLRELVDELERMPSVAALASGIGRRT